MIDGIGRQRAGNFAAPPFTARKRHRGRIAQTRQPKFLKQNDPAAACARCFVWLRQFEHRADILFNASAREKLTFPAANSPSPRIARRYMGSFVMSSPSSRMRPESGFTSPMIE